MCKAPYDAARGRYWTEPWMFGSMATPGRPAWLRLPRAENRRRGVRTRLAGQPWVTGTAAVRSAPSSAAAMRVSAGRPR